MTMDETIQTDVIAELGWAPSDAAADIGVTARDGVMTLTAMCRATGRSTPRSGRPAG